jgi:hypothetical protein
LKLRPSSYEPHESVPGVQTGTGHSECGGRRLLCATVVVQPIIAARPKRSFIRTVLPSAIGGQPSFRSSSKMAADCSAPRWSFSRLLLLAQSGHSSARSSRPPSVDSPRSVRLPEWPRCASSRSKWTLRTDGLAPVCRAASCHGASTRLQVAPPEHCEGPQWDRSLSPARTYRKFVVLRFAVGFPRRTGLR